jgi:hypothetical protein
VIFSSTELVMNSDVDNHISGPDSISQFLRDSDSCEKIIPRVAG